MVQTSYWRPEFFKTDRTLLHILGLSRLCNRSQELHIVQKWQLEVKKNLISSLIRLQEKTTRSCWLHAVPTRLVRCRTKTWKKAKVGAEDFRGRALWRNWGSLYPFLRASAEHSIAVGLPNPPHFDTPFCYACNRLTLNRTKVKNHSNCKGRGPVGKDLEAPFSERKGCSLWANPNSKALANRALPFWRKCLFMSPYDSYVER